MKSLIDNPKELLELIDSCLKPKQEIWWGRDTI